MEYAMYSTEMEYDEAGIRMDWRELWISQPCNAA